jgi:2-keto-4-pentenoate hydratase/2-oxohepta-3-ene-1,7-dioic acid hydratase in catechol pathway
MGGFLPRDGPPLPAGATPWLLPKLAATVSGDGGEIVVPSFLEGPLWIEAELAIVIGKQVRAASEQEAREAIFGFTVFDDVSAPEFLFEHVDSPKLTATSDVFRAKSIDGFASMGPWIRTDLTPEHVAEGLRIATRVNGVERASGSTRDHKFPVTTWVTHASRYRRLEPGDVIALGTPQPCVAAPGDEVELEIEGIGVLRSLVVAGL